MSTLAPALLVSLCGWASGSSPSHGPSASAAAPAACGAAAAACGPGSAPPLDMLDFGDAASRRSHALAGSNYSIVTLTAGAAGSQRALQINGSEGGAALFELAVLPHGTTHLTVKFWGSTPPGSHDAPHGSHDANQHTTWLLDPTNGYSQYGKSHQCEKRLAIFASLHLLLRLLSRPIDPQAR